jgi:hypothetical protein
MSSMSHEPPIPEAARSPYPLQPPPLPHDESDAAAGETARSAEGGEAEASEEGQSWTGRAREAFDQAKESKVAIGAAIGIGSAALLAALLYARRGSRETKA